MQKDLYLYIYGTERLPSGLDDLEDEIFSQIEGQGDVTGVGTGASGWNIDIEFESMNSANFIARTVIEILRGHGIGDSVTLDMNGHRQQFSEIERKWFGDS